MLKDEDYTWHYNVLIHKYLGRVFSVDQCLDDDEFYIQPLKRGLDVNLHINAYVKYSSYHTAQRMAEYLLGDLLKEEKFKQAREKIMSKYKGAWEKLAKL